MAGDGRNTVLVIEDNPLSMTLDADLLEMNGFNVLKATCAKEALDILKTHIPDLIMLDIRLPDMSGIELFKKIREDNRCKQVKIAAVTASVMKEEEEQILSSGFDAFIPKPIDVKKFVQQVRALIV